MRVINIPDASAPARGRQSAMAVASTSAMIVLAMVQGRQRFSPVYSGW